MAPIPQSSSRNALIRSLHPAGYAMLTPHLKRVHLMEGDLLASADASIETVWFPETAVTSCVDILADGSRIELGIVGYEGMAGWPVLLGCEASPHDVVVQVGGGTALRIPADRLVEAARADAAVASLFLRYVNVFTVQIGRTAVSNLRDCVERRLSRWLLMCHDRLEGDEIDLTHKVIATTLGVRRASVTDGLHNLEGEKVISNRRGRIVINDRIKLKRLAGEGYGHAEAHYSRMIAPFGK